MEALELAKKIQRRHQAEELARHKSALANHVLSYPEVLKLVHELEVHQIELELQKEELEQAKIDVETGLEKYADLYDFAPVGYFTVDDTGVILAANLTGASLLGLERNRLLKHHFQIYVAPDSRASFDHFLQTVFGGRVKCACELALRQETGNPLEVRLEATPVASGPGKGKQCRVVMMDITERKASELARHQLEERLRQTQKQESLGVMAGGIAHDFNNILTVIMGQAELLLAKTAATEPARDSLLEILKATQRAADLSRQMLAFSGKSHLSIAPLDLTALVKEILPIAESAISKKARLSGRFSELPLVVQADAAELRQVILNLILNAAEAIGEREGTIGLATSSRHCARAFLDQHALDPALPEGRYACFEVTDTGCGMDPGVMARIFEPFFTTKFMGRGLGLAAVQGIVRGHRGVIEVRSVPGQGATFRVLLPAETMLIELVQHVDRGPNQWRGSGRVLVVDDEEMVRNLAQTMLERMGFTVLTAADGCEAVEIFEQNPEGFACVLLDLTMPRMDGREALHELRRLRPDVRVVICSGYDSQRLSHLFPAASDCLAFMHKPFHLADFSDTLRALLGGTSSASV